MAGFVIQCVVLGVVLWVRVSGDGVIGSGIVVHRGNSGRA